MSDYISRQVALDALPKPKICEYMDEFGAGRNSCAYDAEKAIKDVPAADVVQVRHGKWTHKPDVYGFVYCSECDYELHANSTSFCPNCGAKMDGERKE